MPGTTRVANVAVAGSKRGLPAPPRCSLFRAAPPFAFTLVSLRQRPTRQGRRDDTTGGPHTLWLPRHIQVNSASTLAALGRQSACGLVAGPIASLASERLSKRSDSQSQGTQYRYCLLGLLKIKAYFGSPNSRRDPGLFPGLICPVPSSPGPNLCALWQPTKARIAARFPAFSARKKSTTR